MENETVVWDEKYATGIGLIDAQHKQLIVLTNQLYNACFADEKVLEDAFKKAMHQMVEYVRFHFIAELKLLDALKFPDYNNHKKKHDQLIQDILSAVKDYNDGKKLVPNHFVRTLKDWIFSHIAIYDKEYSAYFHHQIEKGVLSEQKIKEIESTIENS